MNIEIGKNVILMLQILEIGKVRNLVDTNYTNTSCIEHSAPGHRLFSANGGEKRSWGENT